MHTRLLDLDEHATLWPDLSIHVRYVRGPEDITVGTHPTLGVCVIRHFGLESQVAWTTAEKTCVPVLDGSVDNSR